MSEHPPKPLSEGKQRKIARTQAKEGNFHARAKEAFTEAKEAHGRAIYVEKGPLQRIVERGVLESMVPNANLKKYDQAAFESAPVEEGADLPEKGGARRKAARAYSREHDLSGQIKKERDRLKNLTEKTKELEMDWFSRLLRGTRGKKYARALYNQKPVKETTAEDIKEALSKVERDELVFHSPTPKRTIEVQTSSSAHTGDSDGLRREVPRAYPEVETIPPQRAPAPAYDPVEAQKAGKTEDAFDDMIEAVAIKQLQLLEKPDKARRNFFKHLDGRRGPDFAEAAVSKIEAHKAFVEAKQTTKEEMEKAESALIFALMDFYRTKFDDTTDLGREMIYQATIESLRVAREEQRAALRARGLPQTRGRARVRVETDSKRRNQNKAKEKKRRFPWLTLGAIASILTAGWAGTKVVEMQQERAAAERALEELDEPATYENVPPDPRYPPAPRISMTEAAQEAESLTPLSEMTPEQERAQARANASQELRQYGEVE